MRSIEKTACNQTVRSQKRKEVPGHEKVRCHPWVGFPGSEPDAGCHPLYGLTQKHDCKIFLMKEKVSIE